MMAINSPEHKFYLTVLECMENSDTVRLGEVCIQAFSLLTKTQLIEALSLISDEFKVD
jgi:hypothetical protein